jgi:4-amino-4-deoxy-L-arabinose transferase-like glycosyltransferase
MTPRLRFRMLGLAAAILFLGAIRLGDLPGFDDAMYSTQAKNIVNHGHWLAPEIRGAPSMEHPPLFVWTQAAFLLAFGKSDPVAKLPVALSAIATVFLIYWLARRLLDDSLAASIAMFVMLATPYFIKYAGHAMTDVPAAFLFLCAISAWSLADGNPRWYLAAGTLIAMALMVRGLIGLALPAIFFVDLIARRKRPPLGYLVTACAVAFVPITLWYAHFLLQFSGRFVQIHEVWLNKEVFGPLSPPWRRYTGLPEYLWMIAKSYWPWLPFTIAGIIAVIRERRRPLFLLLGWIGAVLLLCAAARSRVLRYMLPAYPAFAILAAIGLTRLIPRRILERAMNWAPPFALGAALAIALFFRPTFHARETRAIAEAESRALPPGATIGFYDKGDPRQDEANEVEWYGDDVPTEPYTDADLEAALRAGQVKVFLIDRATWENRFAARPHDVIAQAGHLVTVRLR